MCNTELLWMMSQWWLLISFMFSSQLTTQKAAPILLRHLFAMFWKSTENLLFLFQLTMQTFDTKGSSECMRYFGLRSGGFTLPISEISSYSPCVYTIFYIASAAGSNFNIICCSCTFNPQKFQVVYTTLYVFMCQFSCWNSTWHVYFNNHSQWLFNLQLAQNTVRGSNYFECMDETTLEAFGLSLNLDS